MSKDKDATNLSRTFKYLLATQFLSRGIPFIFNTWIVRHLTQEDYALYAVQFHLFVTCILFLSREGFRRACLRMDLKCDGTSLGEDVVKLMKVVWMSFPLGILITILVTRFVFWWQQISYFSPHGQAILINGFACILELLAEPLYILSQNLVLLKLRLVVETVATLSRCLTMYFLIVKQTGIEKSIIFALSQSAYGACLFLGYWGYLLLFKKFRVSYLFPFSLGREKYKRPLWATGALDKPSVTVQEMVMLSTSVLSIKWTLRGKPKSVIGGDLILRVTSIFTLNQISGQVIEHEELWDLSASSASAQAFFWTSRALFATVESVKDFSDNAKNLSSKISTKKENLEIYPDPSGDPTKFFQRDDGFQQDAYQIALLLAVIYLVVQFLRTTL